MDKGDGDRGAAPMMNRRRLLQSAAWAGGAIATGIGSWVIRPKWASAAGPIKVGIATDLTGAAAFSGKANANVAKMVVKDINNTGGILGRPIQLFIEDTASNESVAVANVRKLIQRDKVDVVLAASPARCATAIQGRDRGARQDALHLPQQYEGRECTPYIFCTANAAQQCDELIPWLMKNGGKRFARPSANYIWPHITMNTSARSSREGGEVILEEYYPLDQVEYSATITRS